MPTIRNFFISFSICLVIFSVIAFFTVGFAKDALIGDSEKSAAGDKNGEGTENSDGENNDGQTQDNPDQNGENEIKGQTFSAVIIGKDITTNKTDSITFLKVDKENKRFVISSIPADIQYTLYCHEGETHYAEKVLLSETADLYGNKFLKDKLSSLLGVKIDFYAAMDVNGAKNILDAFGPISYHVETDMNYVETDDKGQETTTIDLKSGTQRLDGNKAIQLLRFKGYANADGDEKRRAAQRNYIKSLLSQILTDTNKPKAEAKLSSVLSYLDTDFKTKNLTDNIDLIFSYKSFEWTTVAFPDSIKVVSDDSVARLHSVYKAYR